MSKPTFRIERLGFDAMDPDRRRDWYAVMIVNQTSRAYEDRFSCLATIDGPLRRTRCEARKDAKRLRRWWKRRPR